MTRGFGSPLKLVIALAVLVGASATASAEEFYKGRTILFIVGFTPGGGYDTYTRAIARHIGRHIPGNPTLIVQNMSGGAGGLIAANYIYKRAKPDGLTIGVWNSGLVLRQALGDKSVEFKADEFGWIGSPVKGVAVCGIMGFTGLETLSDILNSKKPIRMGATSAGNPPFDVPRILNLTLGTRFKVIPGYLGTRGILIAMQRREVHGACWGWESMRVIARPILNTKGDDRLIPFVIINGDFQDPEVKNLPRLTEVIKGKENRAIVSTYRQPYNFRRPLALPPGTPEERLVILRRAFEATLEDPKFLAEAKRSKLTINYVSGEQIEKLVDEILAISPETKEKLQFLVSKKPEREP